MAAENYSPRTFNKCMYSVKYFFEFLIDIEEIDMKNPMRNYVPKEVLQSTIESVSKTEFELILVAVDKNDPIMKLGGKGEKKNMYRAYLKDAFRLFLLTGCRREELVVLRWSDIYESEEKVKFLYIDNIKVQRIKNKETIFKPIPITVELMNLLIEMGYNSKYTTDEYILHPNRDEGIVYLMGFLSKSFTHYWKSTGVNKNYSLKTLRKTYLTWVNRVMGDETKILLSLSLWGLEKVLFRS